MFLYPALVLDTDQGLYVTKSIYRGQDFRVDGILCGSFTQSSELSAEVNTQTYIYIYSVI